MQALIDSKEAAKRLGISHKTLDFWRFVGRGPKFISISRRCCRYRPEDLDEWVKSRLAGSTTEAAQEKTEEK